mmetsp:Transcript_7600/g.10771  ORF Transcript_7600/g.10771 Transcript_7600/m.10771 type:complete len:319 (-) Transcript_7600:1524-2480(-)
MTYKIKVKKVTKEIMTDRIVLDNTSKARKLYVRDCKFRDFCEIIRLTGDKKALFISIILKTKMILNSYNTEYENIFVMISIKIKSRNTLKYEPSYNYEYNNIIESKIYDLRIHRAGSLLSHAQGVSSFDIDIHFRRIILAGGLSGSVKLWFTHPKIHLERSIKSSNYPVLDLKILKNKNSFLCNYADKKLISYELKTFRRICNIGVKKQFTSILLHPYDHNIVYTGCTSGIIYEWSLREGKLVSQYNGHLGMITSLINLDRQYLLSSSEDKSFGIWKFGLPIQIKKISRTFIGSLTTGIKINASSCIAYQSKENKVIF